MVCILVVAALAIGFSEAWANQQGLYGGHAQSMRNRRAAYTDAARLLARLRVPADARPGPAVARAQLHELEAADNHADAGRRWTVPGTLSSVIAYVRRHRPRGSSVVSTGYGNSGSITSRSITFAWPSINEVLSDRNLFVSVSSAGHGHVELFAQAESIWLSARPQSERFPTSTRRIVLRITEPHHRTLVREIMRAAVVRRVVALLNAVPITQPVYYNCPAFTQIRDFSYSLLSQTGRSLAHVRYQVPPKASPSPCEPMSVAIGGRPQHTLLGGPQLVTIQRIFHIPTDRASL